MVKYARIFDLPSSLISPEILGVEDYLQTVQSLHYGDSNSLEYGLEKHKNYHTEIILYSDKIKNSNFDQRISKSYLKEFDIIVVNSFKFLEDCSDLLRLIKNECRILVWDGVGMNLKKFKHSFHAILTCSYTIVRSYESAGVDAYYLPFSYDNRLDDWLGVENSSLVDKDIKTAFIGGLNVGKTSHFDRIDLLYNISADVDLYLKDNGNTILKSLYLFSSNPNRALRYLRLNRSNMGVRTGLDYHRTILEYGAIINKHLDGITTPSNIRLFEVTGLGRVLITDRLEGLSDLFIENEEVLAYSNVNELKEHVKNLKKNPEYASYLARNARNKTISKYSIVNRVKKFVEIYKQIN